MLDISIEQVLLFVVAVFLLYHFMNRCSCTNRFSVGGQISDTDAYNTLINNLIKNKIKDKYKDYGNTFEINGNTYYNTKKRNNKSVCEEIEITPVRTYAICDKDKLFCKKNILDDTCMSRTDILNYITSGVKNGEI